ncbi:MAG: (d)CMP kinase [Clostridia bacterium]|nr:(d)CMP kinase [Clostridia bacterium]
MNKRNIAIDGPAGSGKSTIAKLLSEKMGYIYLDTGAMYRAAALYFIRKNIKPCEKDKIISELKNININIEYHLDKQLVFLNGEDVTGKIRTPEVSSMASNIAVIPDVRIMLVDIQRNIANNNNVIMDGRDIGTYVLPHADKKFYLTATVEERAVRRYKELKEKGCNVNLTELKKEIKKRDENDMNREFAPLKKASDAILIDTTNKSIEQVVAKILAHI